LALTRYGPGRTSLDDGDIDEILDKLRRDFGSTLLARIPGGQSGTADSGHQQDAVAPELRVGVRVDEHVDGAVGVRQPHHGELDSRRRTERAHQHLGESYYRVRTPAGKVGNTGECE